MVDDLPLVAGKYMFLKTVDCLSAVFTDKPTYKKVGFF